MGVLPHGLGSGGEVERGARLDELRRRDRGDDRRPEGQNHFVKTSCDCTSHSLENLGKAANDRSKSHLKYVQLDKFS